MRFRFILAAVCALIIALPSQARKRKALTASDMVLVYSGSTRSDFWTKDYLKDYVSYTDRNGDEHWLFDGFLFLEIMDPGDGHSRVCFDPGHKDKDGTPLPSAGMADWKGLVDYYFSDDNAIDAVEQAVAETVERIGIPAQKRQVVISIPNPIVYRRPVLNTGGTKYWGVLDDKVLDFSKTEDRFLACKWFVDQVLAEYKTKHYKYVELAGFYWITEDTAGAGKDLLNLVSDYVHSKGYGMSWIPYFHAPGFREWKENGFDNAYYQPNYFFSQMDASRVETACHEAVEAGMRMEMEFDERAMGGENSWAHKLCTYMEVYRREGVWANKPLAYYQSMLALRKLKYSDLKADNDLYYDFCDFVVSRPCRQDNGNSR